MSVFDPVFETLDNITTIKGRVFHAVALKNASPPFVFWQDLSESTEQTLGGYTELMTAGCDVHIVAAKRAQLDPIAAAVRSALIAMQGTVDGGYLYERINLRQVSPELHEKEVNLYRKVFNLVIDYQEVMLNEQI